MVHSFTETKNANGNTTVEFMENGKRRAIIFQKGTAALKDFNSLEFHDLKDSISKLKAKYVFKANENNRSIFRPIQKKDKENISFNHLS